MTELPGGFQVTLPACAHRARRCVHRVGATIAGVQIELHTGIGGVQKQLQGLFFKLAGLQLTTIGVVAALVTVG